VLSALIFSRNGKGAFAIGLFDERIALTIPQETSTGGVPAYRIVDVLNTERTDHNYYGLNWLSNNFVLKMVFQMQ